MEGEMNEKTDGCWKEIQMNEQIDEWLDGWKKG